MCFSFLKHEKMLQKRVFIIFERGKMFPNHVFPLDLIQESQIVIKNQEMFIDFQTKGPYSLWWHEIQLLHTCSLK